MTYARKELCEELFKLSAWTYSQVKSSPYYMLNAPHRQPGWSLVKCFGPHDKEGKVQIPAYDAPYLFRELSNIALQVEMTNDGKWQFRDKISGISGKDDNAEDALARLCINLFKEGKLQKEVA